MMFMKQDKLRLCLCGLLVLFLALITAGCDDESDEDMVMTPRMIADVNKPGVVMITNIYTASIAVRDCMISVEQNQQLLQSLSNRMRQGELKTQQDVLNAYVEEIA